MKALLEIRLRGLWNSFFKRLNQGKKIKPITKILIAVLVVYIVVGISFSVGGMFYLLGETFISMGYDWMYFALMALLGIVISVIGSIFVSSGMLFEAKDNELLLSMPISPNHILLTRVLALLVLEYLYTFMVTIPVVAVYIMISSLNVIQWIFILLGSLLYPLLSLAIACLIGWVIAYISSKLPFKTLFQTLLLFGFFGSYLWFITSIQKYMTELLTHGETLAKSLSKAFPPAYYFGEAVASSNSLHFVYFVLMCLVPTLIAYVILSRNYLKILMTNKGEKKVAYKKKSLKTSSVFIALVQRELKRFTTMPIYMFNNGIGVMMHILVGGMLMSKGDEMLLILNQVPQWTSYMNAMIIATMVLITSMNQVTAPSISLEGENMWILKSSPISVKKIFNAKIMAHCFISSLGIIIGNILICFAIEMTLLEAVMLFVLPLLATYVIAVIGLIWNLMIPNMHWTNATLVIKQSGSVLGATLSSMVMVAMPIILYVATDISAIISVDTYYFLCIIYLILIAIISVFYLMHEGVKKYQKI